MATNASALYRTKRCLLLLAEVVVAVAAGLADSPDLRLHRAFVAAFAHGHEPGDFALQPLLGLLELGPLVPHCGQSGGPYKPTPWGRGAGLTKHPFQHIQ